MKIKIIAYLYCLFIFSCVPKDNILQLKKEFLNFEVVQLNRSNDDQYSTHLIIDFPIEQMVFEKKSDYFESSLTVDVYISDSKNKIVYSNSWDEKILKNFYEDTKVKTFHTINHFFYLKPDTYLVDIIINDFANHIAISDNKKFNIIEHNNISAISIHYNEDGDYINFVSDDNSSELDTLWVKYFVYNNDNFSDNIELSYYYYYRNKIVKSYTLINDSIISEEPNFSSVLLNLEESYDRIKIELSYKNEVRTKTLKFTDRIVHDFDLFDLIGPMRYLIEMSSYLKFDELDSLKKIEYIKNYWGLVEPIEESKDFNLFKEFHSRVNKVNVNYGYLNKEGWNTDRGQIYITHGRPSEITHEFNQNGEFELWHYSNNKEFIFYNKYGIYELYNGTQ